MRSPMQLKLLAVIILLPCCFSQNTCPCSTFAEIEQECIDFLQDKQCGQKGNIIDGVPTEIRQWSYMVALQIQYGAPRGGPGCYKHHCAGVLVASNVVVSAAHCFDRFVTPGLNQGSPRIPLYAAVAPPCRHLANNGVRVNVDYIYISEDWSRDTASGDLAILILDQAMPPPYVKLRSEPFQPDVQERVTVAGWGAINPEESSNKRAYNLRQLYEMDVDYLDTFVCGIFLDDFRNTDRDAAYSTLLNPDKMFCAYNQASDTCGGDSGGPAVLRGNFLQDDVLVGIVSWGPWNQCKTLDSRQAPGVFTRIDAYYDWIQEIISQQQAQAPLDSSPQIVNAPLAEEISVLVIP